MKKTKVEISKNALKEIEKLPISIVKHLMIWITSVETKGIREIRKISGYHDEPLKGIRFGQRSIRLNKAYRAIYIIKVDEQIELMTVLEVHKHRY